MSRVRSAFVVLLTCVPLALTGCGGDKEKEGESGESSGEPAGGGDEATEAPEGGGDPLDCAAFGAKVIECKDVFRDAYAKTEAADRAGRGDGAKAAKNFVNLMHTEDMAADTCKSVFGDRGDERWAGCMEKSDCAEWAECIAPAISDNVHMLE